MTDNNQKEANKTGNKQKYRPKPHNGDIHDYSKFRSPKYHSPNDLHILCKILIPEDILILSHEQQPLPQTIWDMHTSYPLISIVPTLQTITEPTQKDVSTMNNNSHKYTTLIDKDDNNGKGTTSASPTTRINNKFTNLIEADYDDNKI